MKMNRLFQLLILPFILLSCAEPARDNQDLLPFKEQAPQPEFSGFTDSTVHTVRVRYIGSLARIFNDKNDVQIVAAERNGITPIYTLHDAYSIDRPLVRVSTCDEFYLDTLTHSMPYLRPEALRLLKDIGRSFSDTIKARTGGKNYRIRVTSLLRTAKSVKMLRRRNRNASDNSAHQYGTTFDISYIRFMPGQSDYRLNDECMKNVLGEVLNDLRNRGRCYVKFERKQSCFHITVR